MNWIKQYEEKMTSLAGAAAFISSGDCIWSGGFGAAPTQLLDAIADRKDELHDVRIISSMVCDPHRYLRGEFKGHIEAHCIFVGPYEREFFPEGNVWMNSCPFCKTGYALQHVYKVDTMICEVSEPDENGEMYYGPMGAAWNGRVASYAKKIIVMVNRNQGKVRGKNVSINVTDVDAICRFDHPLPELLQPPVSETDQAIASYIIPNIPDGATLQVGLGGIANAVAYGLEDKKHIRIHTEMLTDSMVYLAKKGVIDEDKILAGFGLGSKENYDYCSTCIPELGDIDEINNPVFASQNDHFISINSCLVADVTGQVGSESIGFRQFSATGGQLDYVKTASMSKGGQSYLCLKSTVKQKDGSLSSTIVTSLPPGQAITSPRSEVMYIVTEYGKADLYCKPLRERVREMIAIAHPDFREQLTREAVEAGLIL